MKKPYGKPRVVSATKVDEIMLKLAATTALLQDIISTINMSVHQRDRLNRRIKDLRE